VRLIDATHAQVLRQSSQKIRGKSDDALFDAVSKAVDELFPAVTAASPPPVAPVAAAPSIAVTPPAETSVTQEPPASHSHILSFVLWGGATLAVGAATYGYFGPVQSFQSAKSNRTPESANAAASLASNANTWGDVGIVACVVAAGAVVGGVFTW
jgi:hypothetical protein